MRRTKLQMLMERDTEAFRKELLHKYRMHSDDEWQANGVFYRECTFIINKIKYGFTMCNGEVTYCKWVLQHA